MLAPKSPWIVSMNLIQLWRFEHLQAKEDSAIRTSTALPLGLDAMGA
jgi:hypothetical protein